MNENPTPEKCAVCATPCCGLAINGAHLCDAHFDAWLEWPRDPKQGAAQRMADFMAVQREVS